MDKSVADFYLDLYSNDDEGEEMSLDLPEEITFNLGDEVIIFAGPNRDNILYGTVVEVDCNKGSVYSHLFTTYKVVTEEGKSLYGSNKCMKLRSSEETPTPTESYRFEIGQKVKYYDVGSSEHRIGLIKSRVAPNIPFYEVMFGNKQTFFEEKYLEEVDTIPDYDTLVKNLAELIAQQDELLKNISEQNIILHQILAEYGQE